MRWQAWLTRWIVLFSRLVRSSPFWMKALSGGPNPSNFSGSSSSSLYAQLLHGRWDWTMRGHPSTALTAPMGSFLSQDSDRDTGMDSFRDSLEDGGLAIDLDLSQDRMRCVVMIHGGKIEGEAVGIPRFRPSPDRPWRSFWKPIHLRRPPIRGNLHFSRMMTMLPLIYRMQRQGVTVDIVRIEITPDGGIRMSAIGWIGEHSASHEQIRFFLVRRTDNRRSIENN